MRHVPGGGLWRGRLQGPGEGEPVGTDGTQTLEADGADAQGPGGLAGDARASQLRSVELQ